MPKHVGTWVFVTSRETSTTQGHDSVKLLRLDVRDENGTGWGTSVGLGWTPTLQVRRAGAATLSATITGDWEDALVQDAATFAIGAETDLVPAEGADPIDYEAVIVMTKAYATATIGVDGGTDPILFRVSRWPS